MAGEWKVDSNGRRYRDDGRCREYEMMIQTSFGLVPESQLEARRNAEAERKKALLEKAMKMEETKPTGLCPFRQMRSCREECTFYYKGKCAVGGPGGDTLEGICPFAGQKCTKKCGLYDNGCKFMRKGE